MHTNEQKNKKGGNNMKNNKYVKFIGFILISIFSSWATTMIVGALGGIVTNSDVTGALLLGFLLPTIYLIFNIYLDLKENKK